MSYLSVLSFGLFLAYLLESAGEVQDGQKSLFESKGSERGERS